MFGMALCSEEHVTIKHFDFDCDFDFEVRGVSDLGT